MDDAMSRCGSLVERRAMTAKVICPGCSIGSPCLREISLQRGGKMLETVTRLHFSMPASRNANSKLRSSCLCVPTPLVRKIFDGTKCIVLNPLANSRGVEKQISCSNARVSSSFRAHDHHRAHPNALHRRYRRDPADCAQPHRPGRQERRADCLPAGAVSVPLLLPDRGPRQFQTRGADPGPWDGDAE